MNRKSFFGESVVWFEGAGPDIEMKRSNW